MHFTQQKTIQIKTINNTVQDMVQKLQIQVMERSKRRKQQATHQNLKAIHTLT